MSFHVRLQRQVFFTEETYNLSESELRRLFVEPWLAGKPIIIKGRTWVPERSRIAILEGPDLTSTQRSWVQGWTKAIELSENVTDRFLNPPPILVEKARSAERTTTKPENGAREAEPEGSEREADPVAAGNEEAAEAPEGSSKPVGKPWYRTVFDVSTARGVVVASGVAREVGEPTREAVYVMGLSSEAAPTEGAGAEGEGDSLQKLGQRVPKKLAKAAKRPRRWSPEIVVCECRPCHWRSMDRLLP